MLSLVFLKEDTRFDVASFKHHQYIVSTVYSWVCHLVFRGEKPKERARRG